MPAISHIRKPRLRRPDALALIIAAVALLGAAIVLYRQSAYGVAISGDSVHYIAMSRNMLAGHGFMSFDGGYPTAWPPLTSALYAVFSLGVFDPLSVAGPLNAAALALSVSTVGMWLRRRAESRFIAVWACLAVAFAAPFVRIFDWAWSEPQFIFLTTLALYCADRHLEDGKRSSLAWAAALSALVCLSRYAGVALVIAVAGMILLRRGVRLRERAANAAVYSAVSLLPLAAWLARNLLNSGHATEHDFGRETALEHVAPMLATATDWWLPYVPIPGAEGAAVWITACALALTFALAAFALFKWLRAGAGAFVPLLVGFAAVYSALALIGLTSGVADDSGRYAAPAYIPLLMAAAFALDRALSRARGVRIARRTLISAAMVAALASWTAYGGYVAFLDAREKANGGGYGGRMGRAFHESETINYLRERRGAGVGTTFSNEPLRAYLASNGRGIYSFARLSWNDMAAALKSRYDADGETAIAWFHDANLLPTGYGAAAFRHSPGFEPMGYFQDGAVFRLNPGYPPSDPRAGTLVLDSYYDVYLNDGALTWVRQPCSDADARGIVELRAEAVNPADAGESGGAGMNFEFRRHGVKMGDLCVIRRALPDYPVKTIRTGQIAPGGEWLYRALVQMPISDEALAFYRAEYESASAGELLARSDFDVYLDGGDLVYLKSPCAESDARGRFYLSAFPKDAAHFPEGDGRGHQSMNFVFGDYGAIFDGKCMARRTLPNYPLKHIETGQWLADGRRLWSASFQMPLNESELAAYREKYAELSAREPLARSGFDVHLDGGDLAYLKQPCAEQDARGVFLLSAFPLDLDVLPKGRGNSPHMALDFDFVRHGAIFDDKCMARRALPGYAIKSIQTGQRIPGGGELWSASFAMPLTDASRAYYRDEYDAIASRAPLSRSDFDVYRDGGDFVYLKQPCAESDARGRFYLSVFPADPRDLPESRRAMGHDALNFAFSDYGVRFGDRCMIRRALPGYPINAIETGQWIPGGGELWSAKIEIAGGG